MAGELFDPFTLGAAADPQARQKALLEALRARAGMQPGAQAPPDEAGFSRAWGNLGMLSGDKVLGNFGQQMGEDARHRESMEGQQQALMLSRALEAQRQASAEEHQREMERQGRMALQQGKFAQGPYGVLNTRTGQLDPYSKESGAGLKPKDIEEQFDKLTKAVSTTQGRANLNAENQKRLYASERVKAVALGPDGQPMDLTPQQLTELAAASGSLISNGSPTEHTIQSLLPRGMGLRSAQLQEWLLNEPKGAGQQAFVKMMIDQANREEKLIHGQLKRGQSQALPNFWHLRTVNPDRFEGILRGAGLDPSEYDDRGLLRAMEEAAAAASTQAPDGRPRRTQGGVTKVWDGSKWVRE